MDEATRIMELIDADFLQLLKDEVGSELEDAVMNLRHNPAKALRHIRNAQLSIETILRSAELVHSRADRIVAVLESAPAYEDADGAQG